MTLLDILNEIDVRMPNTFGIEQKIKWLDIAQTKLYKTIGKKHTYTFVTVANQELYTLPDNIAVENISELWIADSTSVTSNYNKYTYSAERYVFNTGNIYYRSDYDGLNQIGLYPSPTVATLKCKIIYRSIPEKIDGSNLLKIPDIEEDFHEMLINDVIMRITLSGDNPDSELYENYRLEYVSMNVDAQLAKYEKEPQYPRTRDVMKRNRTRTHKQYIEYIGT